MLAKYLKNTVFFTNFVDNFDTKTRVDKLAFLFRKKFKNYHKNTLFSLRNLF